MFLFESYFLSAISSKVCISSDKIYQFHCKRHSGMESTNNYFFSILSLRLVVQNQRALSHLLVIYFLSVEKCSCTIFVIVIVILIAIIVGLIVHIIWLHRRGNYHFVLIIINVV